MANMLYAAWFSAVTWYIPTPDYGQIWFENTLKTQNHPILPNIAGC